MDGPQLGKLIEDGDRRRDAIHIAVAPVTAGQTLFPGNRVGFRGDLETAYDADTVEAAVGIVDPFLTLQVKKGERFWMFLMPNTVTSLRHVWTHPAFVAGAPKEILNG